MQKELRYAVVGCGEFGNAHLHALSLITGIKVVSLCDVHIEKCEERKTQYKLYDATCYTDYNKMLEKEEIDIVVVATSDKSHAPITIAALKSGRHVMCEKPMSLFTEECEAMVKAAEEAGKYLMVGQVCRCAPGFVKAKEIVDSGLIGELYFVESEYAHDYSLARGVDDWRVDKDREPIIGGACHAIDLLRWIAGDPIETTAYSNHKMLPDWPVPDTTIAILKFPNDVIGKIFTSIGCKRNYTMRTVLYGTKGTIIVDNTSTEMQVFLEKSEDRECFAGGYFGDTEEKAIKHSIIVSVDNHNVAAEHEQMIAAVTEGRPLVTDGREGGRTVCVCRAVVESAATGKTVEIKYNV